MQADSVGVIVGRDLIGDALYKLPFVRALRAAFPAARICWITTEGPSAFAGPLRAATAPLLDEVIECAPIGSRLAELPRLRRFDRHFAVLIDTRGRWQHALLARRVPHDLFVSAAARFLFSDRRPRRGYRRPEHIVARLLDLLELACGTRPPAAGTLALDPAIEAAAAAALPPGPVYVMLAPGAGNRVKVWPLDNFIAVAAAQAARQRVPVFLLGPDEADWRERIAAAVPAARFPLQEAEPWGGRPLAIEHTIAVARRAAVAVANDSGTSHMIAAADRPLVSLFGPTRPGKLAPLVSRGAVIDAADYGGEAMALIPVAAVEQAIERLLAEAAAAQAA